MTGAFEQPAFGETCRPSSLARGYILDLDGTIYLGDALLPGARRFVETLQALERNVLFLSNNPTRTPAEYVSKLSRLGIPVDPDQILTTVDTMTSWLLLHHPGATVFPIAEQPLIDALQASGIAISDDPTRIDIVIASYDRLFDYRKLQIAFDAIRTYGRAFLVATNPDRFCPFPGGRGEPDAGAIIGAVEGCTGARLQQNTGKPDRFMLEAALNRLGLTASDCVMIGDRLATDIRMALDAGMPSALVLTGDATRDDLATLEPKAMPTWVLERIDQVLPEDVTVQLPTRA